MSHAVEIRTYRLKPGTREEFSRVFHERAAPMLTRWGVDVVGFGPSLHDPDSYYLIRRYDDPAARERSQGAFYGSDEWKTGPRDAILACIENYVTVVVTMDDEAVNGLRRSPHGKPREKSMATRATSSFDVTGWEPTPYDEGVEGPQMFRVKVRKAFRGDLVGESTAELLMCINDPKDLGAGAGYVVSERVVGQLGDKRGTFILQHWGVSGAGRPPTAAGHVVPGSGTGQLAGLVGSLEISQDTAKNHTLVLDYDFV